MKMVKIWKAGIMMRDSCKCTMTKEIAFNTSGGDWGRRLEKIG
jgi:hypothetical protein